MKFFTKGFKKGIITLLILGVFVMGFTTVAYACDKTANCYATGKRSQCGYVQRVEHGHQVVEPNGYTSWCTVTVVSGPHYIYCTGCNAPLGQENRQCAELHSNPHCYSKENMCK